MEKDGILVSLGYSVNDGTIAQLEGILNSCDFTDTELEKIILLNDNLKKFEGYVAMSNSNSYFKIKNENSTDGVIKGFRETIFEWADRYKFGLEKVDGRETYYIVGKI
ncbi:MAG: type II secretion system protein [Campylobacter sp.]|nr:type II secretion system protein [Campylobacter sp.]